MPISLPKPCDKAPSTENFKNAIRAILAYERANGKENVSIKSGILHRALGGYPGHNHNMPGCCNAMRAYAEKCPDVKATITDVPDCGNGATLVIKYTFVEDVTA